MTLQFTWQGCDSLLAAPLAIDLARLALLAQRRGEGGVMGTWRASSSSSPMGTGEQDFFRQWAAFDAYAPPASGRRRVHRLISPALWLRLAGPWAYSPIVLLCMPAGHMRADDAALQAVEAARRRAERLQDGRGRVEDQPPSCRKAGVWRPDPVGLSCRGRT